MGKKFLKITVWAIVVMTVVFFSVRYYIYNAGKRDVSSEDSAFSVNATVIVNEFSSQTDASNKKYLEKAISVTGTITAVEGTAVTLDNSVNCNFTTKISGLKTNQKVKVKGRVIGFDDLLGELKLDQCTIQE